MVVIKQNFYIRIGSHTSHEVGYIAGKSHPYIDIRCTKLRCPKKHDILVNGAIKLPPWHNN